jgi:hypothetical protein
MALASDKTDKEIENLNKRNMQLQRRIAALERNQRELENRILQLRTLYEIGSETASMLEPAAILQVILARILRASPCTRLVPRQRLCWNQRPSSR